MPLLVGDVELIGETKKYWRLFAYTASNKQLETAGVDGLKADERGTKGSGILSSQMSSDDVFFFFFDMTESGR
jgi:hypothetical protein